MALRDYQQRAIDELYRWFLSGNAGNPCIEMPTGSGKSYILAELCRDVIQSWPDQKILILTHVKELIEQDAEKILMAWPSAPMGIYSAGLGMRQLGEPITIAGIQSVRKRAREIGYIDLVIVDEAHLISHKEEGGYRKLIADLQEINPALRVIGLTATPYRLGHGLITDKPALFDDILTPTSIEELIAKGYLAPLRSKDTELKLSTDGVAKRGGEFVESDLQRAVNTSGQNSRIVDEVLARAGDRKAWLFFCSGVDHAIAMRDILLKRGIPAACVLGETPKEERRQILEDFKAGLIKAVTNANVLTTGFNYPDIDLIAMCRPTMSPGLYLQMAGRGMRIKSHIDDCLVLDFAGLVRAHGPVTAVQPPRKAGVGTGEAPVKVCEECHELVHLAARICPACGHEFPPPQVKLLKLHNDDIMGKEKRMPVRAWEWARRISFTSGKTMATVTYYGESYTDAVTEYFCLLHGGYAGQKAIQKLFRIAKLVFQHIPEDMARESEADLRLAIRYIEEGAADVLDDVVEIMNELPPPSSIAYQKDGKFFNTYDWEWVQMIEKSV